MKLSELRAHGITLNKIKAITGHSNPAVWGKTDEVPPKYEAMLEPYYQAALKALVPDYSSDPIAPEQLRLARSSGGYANTTITPWEVTQDSLAKELSTATIGQKDGAYFLRCSGSYRDDKHTADTADILPLDGDKRIIENGELVDGAPHPGELCAILANLGVSFVLLSSFSNGATREELAAKVNPGKPEIDTGGVYGKDFHKYRVLIFCTYSREQLPALLDYLFKELHQAGVMLADVKEQHTWSQPWYFPRVPDAPRKALFKFEHHIGNKKLDVDEIYRQWLAAQHVKKAAQDALRTQSTHRAAVLMGQGKTALDACNESFSIQQLMSTYGFVKAGKKYISPHSESGNAQFLINGKKWTSFHGSDAEAGLGNAGNNGERFGDAFDLFVFFEHGNDYNKALIAAGNMFTSATGKTINQQQQIEHMAAKNDTVVFAEATNTQDDEIESLREIGSTSKTAQTANYQDDIDYSTMPDYGEPPTEQRATSNRYANADELADDAQAPDYLINDILESNSHGMMGGASQSLKTFMALKMAHSICTGNDFFGSQVFKTGKVIYICGEGRGALNRRIKALKIAENGFNDNLHVLKLSLCIDNLADMDAVKKDVEQHKPVLAIFDTFSSLTANANENDNSDVARVMRLVRESCNGSGASTLVIHHYGKDATRGLRGASAFFNNVDFVHEMTRAEGSMIATMACKKMKDGETFPDFDVQADVIELGLIRQDGKVATSLVLKMPDAENIRVAKKEKTLDSLHVKILTALYESLNKHGTKPPAEIISRFPDSPQNCPIKVVHINDFRPIAYPHLNVAQNSKRTVLRRCIENLEYANKAMFYNDYLWGIE